ncbi:MULTISPECIES: SDR family oxidoreductase [Acinetobacter]|uniref:SDR family oxidoreductase n=1 Tax=Acinetobacter TaxID=469 RepID=UPI00143C5344|nr:MULTISPECIES: SDR family oxidoreductase [Acinetobacter]MDD0802964.1 SDR family oxidoreductase [Acinetobacter sp. Gutcm_16]NKG38103.1 SDR family oxidoreductase [Acinetobacter johnsonii]
MTQIKLNGKVALVTGANSGIGAVTVRELALQGYHVFLACRDADKAQQVINAIDQQSRGQAKAEFIALDLASLDSIRACAAQFLAKKLPLHLLICNAGLAGHKGMTKSGFELTFGVCHVGHFLLTQLLTEKLIESKPARVVVVSSKAHRHAKGIDFDAVIRPTESMGALKEYAVAKLANVLFVKELGRRLYGTGVTAYAVHPGVVSTNVWRSLPKPMVKVLSRWMISPEEGAQTTLYCATQPQLSGETGMYYDNCKVTASSGTAQDIQLARLLWEKSSEWVKY